MSWRVFLHNNYSNGFSNGSFLWDRLVKLLRFIFLSQLRHLLHALHSSGSIFVYSIFSILHFSQLSLSLYMSISGILDLFICKSSQPHNVKPIFIHSLMTITHSSFFVLRLPSLIISLLWLTEAFSLSSCKNCYDWLRNRYNWLIYFMSSWPRILKTFHLFVSYLRCWKWWWIISYLPNSCMLPLFDFPLHCWSPVAFTCIEFWHLWSLELFSHVFNHLLFASSWM